MKAIHAFLFMLFLHNIGKQASASTKQKNKK